MSISRVKEAYEVVQKNCDHFHWADEELIDLISAIAEHILASSNLATDRGTEIPQGYITLDDFISLYPLFCKSTVFQGCQVDTMRMHSVKIRKNSTERWYVHPTGFLDVLQTSCKSFRKKMHFMKLMKNEVQ